MKVAILTPTFSHYSGIDRVVEMQANEFAGKGHEVSVFTFESTIAAKNFKVIVLGMPKSLTLQRIYRLFFFLDRLKIKKAAKMLEGFDRIVSHFYPMNLIAAKAKKMYGVKYIAFNHGIGFSHLFTNPAERYYMQTFRRLSNKSLKDADEVFSVSKFLSDELKEETGIESKVAYNKIDKTKYNPKVNGTKIREKYGIRNEPVILFVGRLSPHKGVHLLIEAFKKLRENKSNAKLIIVGKSTFEKYYNELRRMADRNIIFAGFIDDDELPEYFGACNVYATASRWEGFDIPVVEAQACGKPVVAFDAGSHKEVVKVGKLVQDGDVNGLAKAMLEWVK